MPTLVYLLAATPGVPAAPASGDIAWGTLLMGLAGGLALFLIGMDRMTDALRGLAGDRLRVALARLTANRFSGAVTGAATTAIIQSSSVTTVLVVGFIAAGLMPFSHSLGVIFGDPIPVPIEERAQVGRMQNVQAIAIPDQAQFTHRR